MPFVKDWPKNTILPNGRIEVITSQRIVNMLETLETVRECLITLACHPAFEGDAVEFNEGGIGYEASTAVRTILAEVAADPDTRELAELAEQAVYDATYEDALESARSAIADLPAGAPRDAMASSMGLAATDRMVDMARAAAFAAGIDAMDEVIGK